MTSTNAVRRLAVSAALGALVLLPLQSSAAVVAGNPANNSYQQYKVVLDGGQSGEPSIGWDPVRKTAMYGAGQGISRLRWDDTRTGSPMTQTPVTPTTGTLVTLDTIVTVDSATGRTFFAELAAAGSIISFSDDAGATWTQSTGVALPALLDHESVGVGPFAPGIPHPLATSAVYYCAQNGFNGACGVSYDGGTTYAPATYAYNTPANDIGDPNPTFAAEGGACSALHGHLKVGPDGTAYLPVKGCGGTPSASSLTNQEYIGGVPSVSVSTDNGATWAVRMNPTGNNSDESDNSIAIGPKGTVYMAWEDGINISTSEGSHTSSARVSISTDQGRTWLNTTNLNPAGINNVMFPVVVSGDDDRAAVAFLGTSGIGDDQQNGVFQGSWDMYVATTYDRGLTWSTVNATRGDWVHRGCIDDQGIAPGSPKNNICSNRKLLDFNDISIDSTGRVLVAFTKTCTTPACRTAKPSVNDASVSTDNADYVLRQASGKGLYAAGDGGLPATAVTAGGGTASGTPGLANTAAVGAGGAAGVAGLVALGAIPAAAAWRRRRRR